jgi:cytoskeletal protein RodZ
LADVERDTRISSKYLEALEAGRPETLPAPVYARAFMRTYAQYLGLSAREFVAQLPGARPEPELPPLPDVASATHFPLVPASWFVAGLIVVLVFAAGLILFWNRGGADEGTSTTRPPAVSTVTGAGAEQPRVPTTQPQAPVQIAAGEAIPDLRGQAALVAVQALRQAGLKFFVIEVNNGDVPKSTVFQQSPSPGTAVAEGELVTLVVSR